MHIVGGAVVTLGHCEYDPERNIRNIFILAESWPCDYVGEIVRRRAFDEIPLGGTRRQLKERSTLGCAIDGDFYWNGKPWLFMSVPAMLSDAKPDDAWHTALGMTKEGDYNNLHFLFAG